MKLRYEFLRDDVVALAVHDLETSPRHRTLRLGLRWGLPVGVFGLLAASLPSTYGLAAGALFATTYALRVPAIMRRSCARQAQKLLERDDGRRALGPHRLSLDTGSFTLEAPVGRASFAASAVERVVDTDQHVFIHLRPGGVVAVPKRTLSSDELTALHTALGFSPAAA